MRKERFILNYTDLFLINAIFFLRIISFYSFFAGNPVLFHLDSSLNSFYLTPLYLTMNSNNISYTSYFMCGTNTTSSSNNHKDSLIEGFRFRKC